MPTPRRPLLSRRARRPQLERDTPLRPHAAATVIVEALAVWLGEPLPRGYVAGLAHRARRVYAHSAQFRAKMQRRGEVGRDLLHMFLQHWLADRLQRERPQLFRRLPAGYATGGALPMRSAREHGQEAARARKGTADGDAETARGAHGPLGQDEGVYLGPAQRWWMEG